MLHVCLEDYCRAYLVNQVLVASCHLFQSGIYHCLKSHFRRKPLIYPFQGHFRILFPEPVNKRFNIFHRFRFLSCSLCRITDHDLINILFVHVIYQKVKQLMCRNCCKPVCNYLQRITHCNAALLSSVIDG